MSAVVAQLSERSVPTPDVCSSNPSCHWQNLYWTLTVNYIEKTKEEEKEVGNGACSKKHCHKQFSFLLFKISRFSCKISKILFRNLSSPILVTFVSHCLWLPKCHFSKKKFWRKFSPVSFHNFFLVFFVSKCDALKS